MYNPQEKKLDPRTISGYFIGYAERSKGYRFYCPFHTTRIVESRNAKFLQNNLISGRDHLRNTIFENDHSANQPSTLSNRLIIVHNTPSVQIGVDQPVIEVPQAANIIQVGQGVQELPIPEQPVEPHPPQEDVGAALRRSTRTRKSAIPSDYVVSDSLRFCYRHLRRNAKSRGASS
ncbi:hypothetical protein F0562_034419 [Nyssa sinensis]|uniref:Retroviral polymerase SH3-like domain-containing protein n=1 Tax=Nyssa sinensis TaxID=561372 RepID=A0A5J5AKF9_9ASTE|nr:hypothetical protein F0562_034419 [Nyssa sinensis]